MKYRIIKKTYFDGSVRYRVQYKGKYYFYWYNTERGTMIGSLGGSMISFGIDHKSYKDALAEISYHEQWDKESIVKKEEIIYPNENETS